VKSSINYWTAHDQAWADQQRAAIEAEQIRVVERERATREAIAERERQRLASEAAARRDMQEALALMATRPIEALRRICQRLDADHQIRPVVTRARTACAVWSTRTVYVPPIDTEEEGATNLHERAHILQGRCPNHAPHQRDPTATESWHCLECERDAWVRAMQLVPFTSAMQDRMAMALSSYLRTTPAGQPTRAGARRVISGVAWREEIHRRSERERRLVMAAEIEQWAAEASRRVPTRQERQWQEIQQIARGCV
jgi:hypothetical protein